MANDPEHSEIIETVVDVTMLEEVAEPDKKSSDAATTSAVEEADEEPGKMEVAEIPTQSRKMKEVIEDPAERNEDAATSSTMEQEKLENMEVAETIPIQSRKMKEVIEDPEERNEDAATSSTMEQEKLENMEVVIGISSPLKKVKGFRQRYVDELQSYCANQWKSRNVVHGRGCSGFYKVPQDMRQRQGRDRLYDPTYVNFSKIRDMLENDDPDVQTRSLLSHYFYRVSVIHNFNGANKLKDSLSMIYEDQENIASCYGVKEADLDFLQLLGLLLSSCFVIYLLYLPYNSDNIATEKDTEYFHRWVNDLWVDLLVLENQIPFFILRKFFYKFVHGESDISMSADTFVYFCEFVPLKWIDTDVDGVHLLDIVHRSLLPDERSDHRSFFRYALPTSLWEHCMARLREYCMARSREYPVMRVIPTATRLQQAGVQFRPVERKGFVVEFRNGVLRLPRFHIRKNTEKFFMNLIAWEICHQPAPKYFINYAILMDKLINTPKDVEILIQNNILEHSLATEEEVAAMFNRLGEDLNYTKNEKHHKEYDFLMELSMEVNKYCESRYNSWWANLMSEYFSSPWTILSLIAALLLILLTLVQTFFSAFSYFRPPK